MTKDELIRALDPFTDELEIMIGHAGRWYEVDNHEYAQRFGGEGCLVLNLGAQILLRTRPRMETPADLVGALQDKVHADSGPFRAGRAAKETPAARPCVWRTGCKHPAVCDQQGVCVPGGEDADACMAKVRQHFARPVSDETLDRSKPEVPVAPDTDVASKAACPCKHSDTWRCAVARGLTSVSCGCRCHRATANR